MKTILTFAGVAGLAIAASLGTAQFQAATGAIGDFCPDRSADPRCASAVSLYLAGKPGDDDIIASVNAIAGAAQSPRLTSSQCADLQAGLLAMADGVHDASSAGLIRTLAQSVCSGRAGFGSGGATIVVGAASLSTPQGGGGSTSCATSSSSGSSGQTSGSSGESSSGASGQTSGTSGQSSGSSGGTSGGTGCGSGGDTTSSGTSGNTSGGTSGQTSGGTSGQTSGGTSGNTSGGTSGETSGQ